MKGHELLYLILILKAAAPPGTPEQSDSGYYRGHLLITPEAEVFRPCGSERPMWLDVASETRSSIIKSYTRLRTSPGAETYVLLRGTQGPQPECAHCGQYSGSIMVDAIVEHKPMAPSGCG